MRSRLNWKDFHNCKKGAGPEGLQTGTPLDVSVQQKKWRSIKRGDFVIETGTSPSLCSPWLQFYLASLSLSLSLSLSPQLSLSSLPSGSFFLLPRHTSGNTPEDCDCIAVRKMKTIRVPWIVPLSPSHCFCWWAMGTWQTMGMIGGTEGCTEEDRKPRTGNRVLKERGETWNTRRLRGRLWSSCRNRGMKTWQLAMQLKVRADWKFGCCNWKALNNNPQKTLARRDLSADPARNCV